MASLSNLDDALDRIDGLHGKNWPLAKRLYETTNPMTKTPRPERKHSPAPFRIDEPDGLPGWIIRDNSELAIASVFATDEIASRCNADIFASAPTMMALLIRLRAEMKADDQYRWVNDITDALIEARGMIPDDIPGCEVRSSRRRSRRPKKEAPMPEILNTDQLAALKAETEGAEIWRCVVTDDSYHDAFTLSPDRSLKCPNSPQMDDRYVAMPEKDFDALLATALALDAENKRLREALIIAEKYMTRLRQKSESPYDPEALKLARRVLAMTSHAQIEVIDEAPSRAGMADKEAGE